MGPVPDSEVSWPHQALAAEPGLPAWTFPGHRRAFVELWGAVYSSSSVGADVVERRWFMVSESQMMGWSAREGSASRCGSASRAEIASLVPPT